MQISIRQSGGANIISIPKTILKTLDLHVGSSLELSIEDHKIVLTPSKEKLTLDELLAGSPKKHFQATEEDKQWQDESPKGKEF